MNKGQGDTNEPTQGHERSFLFVISLLAVSAIMLCVLNFVLQLSADQGDTLKLIGSLG